MSFPAKRLNSNCCDHHLYIFPQLCSYQCLVIDILNVTRISWPKWSLQFRKMESSNLVSTSFLCHACQKEILDVLILCGLLCTKAITIKECFLVPTVDERLDELHGSTIFSKFDLCSRHLQDWFLHGGWSFWVLGDSPWFEQCLVYFPSYQE